MKEPRNMVLAEPEIKTINILPQVQREGVDMSLMDDLGKYRSKNIALQKELLQKKRGEVSDPRS